MSDIPTEWPKSGPAMNAWNNDAAAFVKLVQAHSHIWHNDIDLKYLELRIDTRNGGFLLCDRDGKPIFPERVLAALARERTA